MNTSTYNQNFVLEQKRTVFEILEHFPYNPNQTAPVRLQMVVLTFFLKKNKILFKFECFNTIIFSRFWNKNIRESKAIKVIFVNG